MFFPVFNLMGWRKWGNRWDNKNHGHSTRLVEYTNGWQLEIVILLYAASLIIFESNFYFYSSFGYLSDSISDYSCLSQAKGLGYAMNTAEELKFVKDIAATTGVVLDPVYRWLPFLRHFVLVSLIFLLGYIVKMYFESEYHIKYQHNHFVPATHSTLYSLFKVIFQLVLVASL